VQFGNKKVFTNYTFFVIINIVNNKEEIKMLLKDLLFYIPDSEMIEVTYSQDFGKPLFKGVAKLCNNERVLNMKVFTLFSFNDYDDGDHYTHISLMKEDE
jgi:hypothetical protein